MDVSRPRLRLFGGPGLETPQVVAGGIGARRHPTALAAILAVEGGRAVTRDKLVALLWPDADADQARKRLRVALHALREALGHDAVVSVADGLRLDVSSIDCDLVAFESAVDSGRPELAVEAYGGPFLDGFHLPDSLEFDQWADTQRDRLARLYRDALEHLADRCTAAGEPAAAAEWWWKRVREEPSNGRAVVRLMEALERAGDPAAALRQAEAYAQLLREEFDTDPAPEVHALVERIRTDPSPAAIGKTPFTVRDQVRDHDQRRETSGISSGSQRSARRVHLMLTGVLAGIIAIIGVIAFSSDSTPLDPTRVFVAEFVNATGRPELDPVGNLAADWIIDGLGHVAKVFPRESFRGFERDMGAASPAQLLELARDLDAGTFVTGTFYLEGRSLWVHTRILDTTSGQLRTALDPVTASVDSPTAAVAVLRQRVTGAVAALLDPRTFTNRNIEHLARPPRLEAYVAYAEARDLIAIRKWDEAVPLLLRATELDTAFTWASVLSLFALLAVERTTEADSLAKVLQARRERLTPWDQINLDHFAAMRQGAETLPLLRTMYERFPGPLPAYLLAFQELGSGYPGRAIEALDRTTSTSGVLKGGVGYWEVYTRARHMLGQYRPELGAALRAKEDDYPYPLWRLEFEVRALAARCKTRAVEQRLDMALLLPLLGLKTPADVMRVAGLELLAHCDGRTQRLAARRAFERAIEWHRSRPAAEQQVWLERAKLALLYQLTGQDAESERLYRTLAAEQPDELTWRTHLAVLAIRRGDRTEAERLAQELGTLGSGHYFQAVIAAQLGQSEQAVSLLRDGLARGQGVEFAALHWDPLLEPLRGFAPFQELLRPRE